jgi:hypothetical protein
VIARSSPGLSLTYRDLILHFRTYTDINELDSFAASVPAKSAGNGSEASDVRNVLLSEEFQQTLVKRILDAFPEYGRLLFVHIPKCAGSDLVLLLAEKYFSLSRYLAFPEWTSKDALFAHLRRFTRERHEEDFKFFVSGHFRLQDYLDLIRPCDELCTVLRNPVDRVISNINYILTCLERDPELQEPHTRGWASAMGLSSLTGVVFDEHLASSILDNERFYPELCNGICYYLGDGSFRSAMENIKATNIELVMLEDYERWLQAKWGMQTRHENKSSRFISYASLSDAQKAFILRDLVGEDLKLYEALRIDCRDGAKARGASTR